MSKSNELIPFLLVLFVKQQISYSLFFFVGLVCIICPNHSTVKAIIALLDDERFFFYNSIYWIT